MGESEPHDSGMWERLPDADDALRAGADLDSIAGGEPPYDGEFLDALNCLDRLEKAWPRREPSFEAVAGNSAPSLVVDVASGRKLGHFEVIRELGRGAFGVVLLARDERVNRLVALKLPRSEVLFSSELRKRFLDEAHAAARLDHPNVVPIFEAGEIDGVCYIAAAFCAGGNLAEWIAQESKPVAARIAASIIAEIARGVQHAHEHGVLHRDLSPRNVLLAPQPDEQSGDFSFVPRLSDFGLAKFVEQSLEATGTSAIVGTPLYMAPEQAEGRDSRNAPQSDIYSLGAILYLLLTGRPPYAGDTVVQLLDRIRSAPLVPVRSLRADVPRDLEVICHKCLAHEPDQRYESAGALASDLECFLSGKPIVARPLSGWQRFANWCQRPERIRNAGYLTIASGMAFLLWIIIVSAFQYAGFVFDPTDDLSASLMGLVSAIAWYGPEILLGNYTLKGYLFSIHMTIVISLIWMGVLLAQWVGLIAVDVGGMYPTPASRATVEVMIFSFEMIIIVANVIALVSHRANRHLFSSLRK